MQADNTDITLSDHSITLFFRYQRQEKEIWDAPPCSKRAGDWFKSRPNADSRNWLYPHAQESLSNRYANDAIWQQNELNLGKDLHPHIQNALGKAGHQSADARAYTVTNSIKQFINGKMLCNAEQLEKAQKQRKKIQLSYTNHARRRIQQACGDDSSESVFLNIKHIQAVCFRTGWVVLMVEIKINRPEYEAISAVYLQEALPLIINTCKIHWNDPSESDTEKAATFDLAELVYGLTSCINKDHNERVYSACFIEIEKATDTKNLEQMILKLTRKYTDEYKLADSLQNIAVLHDFKNVWHSFALEGCVTCVLTEHAVEGGFIKDYQNKTYRAHYLPIVLLAVHEYNELVGLTNSSSFWPDLDSKAQNDLGELEKLRDRILHFRLCFRFSAVSQISMHNAMNQALRSVFNLDAMLQELDSDTREINEYLIQKQGEQLNQKMRIASIFGTFFITFFTIYQPISDLMLRLKPGSSNGLVELLSVNDLTLSLAASIATGLFVWYKTRPSK